MSTSCANEGTSHGNTSTAATEKTEVIRQYFSRYPALMKARRPPQPICLPPPPTAWCRKNTVTDEIKELTEGKKKKEIRIVEVRSLGYSISVDHHLYVRRTPSEEELYAKFIKKFDSRIKAVWTKDLDQVPSENVPDSPGDDTDAHDDDAERPYNDAESPYVDADTPYDDAEIPDDDAEILHDDAEKPYDDTETINNDLETPGDNPDTPRYDSDAPVADIPMVYRKQIGFYDSEDSLDEVEFNDDEDSSRSASLNDSIGSPDAADQRSSDRSDALKPNASPLLAHIWNCRIFCPECGRQLKIPTQSYV